MRAMKQDEVEDLKEFLKQSEDFTGQAFEWVSTLGQQHLLSHLYDFNNRIKEVIREQEALLDTTSRDVE